MIFVWLLQTTFKVQVSYYEIYKEKIFDLLASTKHKSKTKVTMYMYIIVSSPGSNLIIVHVYVYRCSL